MYPSMIFNVAATLCTWILLPPVISTTAYLVVSSNVVTHTTKSALAVSSSLSFLSSKKRYESHYYSGLLSSTNHRLQATVAPIETTSITSPLTSLIPPLSLDELYQGGDETSHLYDQNVQKTYGYVSLFLS
jgi:hypothetical protein